MAPTKPQSLKLVLEHVLFGILIAFGFALIAGLVIPAAYGHWKTRGETRVPAELVSVEKHHISTKRGKRTSTVAEFVYEVGGQAYTSARISIWRSTGQFFDELDTARRTGKRVKVFIDPNNPSYAVYDREYSLWPSAMAVLMAIVSCGIGIHGFRWRCQKNKQGEQ